MKDPSETKETEVADLFPESYAESRARFRRDLHLVWRLWPDVRQACEGILRAEGFLAHP